MLLWVLILALFGGLVAALGNNLPLSLRRPCAGGAAWVASAFYLFILVTSNPFLRMVDRRSRAATSIQSCRTSVSPASADALSRLCRFSISFFLRCRQP